MFGPSLWPPGRASPAVMCEVREVSVEAAARLAWAGPALARTGGWALHAGGGWAPVVAGAVGQADRAISTGQLHGLPRFDLRPIDVVVYHGSRRDLVLRRVSRLDAFSGYPVRT